MDSRNAPDSNWAIACSSNAKSRGGAVALLRIGVEYVSDEMVMYNPPLSRMLSRVAAVCDQKKPRGSVPQRSYQLAHTVSVNWPLTSFEPSYVPTSPPVTVVAVTLSTTTRPSVAIRLSFALSTNVMLRD